MSSYRRKSLTPEEDDRVREATRRLVAEYGSQAKLAERLGDDPGQQSISKHLNGTPAGVHFAERLAAVMHMSVEDLLGRPTARDDGLPRLDRIPGYAEAEAEARKRAPYLPDSVWETTRASSGARMERVSWPLVLELARVWHRVETGELQPYPMESGRPPPVKPRK